MTPKSLEKIRDEGAEIQYTRIEAAVYRKGFHDGLNALLNAPEFKAVLESLDLCLTYIKQSPLVDMQALTIADNSALAAFNEWVKG